MPRFMLLLHDDPSAWASVSPDQMQTIIQKYVAWGAKLRASGMLHSSDKLTDDRGKVVRGNNGQVRVTDGPFIEAKEVLGGYWMLEADSKEELVKWAQRCPAQKGDVIEIRQIFDCASLAIEK